MSVLEVVDPGVTTTLQDGGRVGAGRWGVPRSGPVDVLAHRLAARLAGVAPGAVARAVAIEVGPHPCTIVARGKPVPVAVAGEGAHVDVDDVALPAPCVVLLRPGERCTIRSLTWAYAVPAGDVDVAPVLGSRSHHPRSGLGPPLSAGFRLSIAGGRDVRSGTRPRPAVPSGPLHVLAAPQTDAFSPAVRARLVEATWTTTTSRDRMGARLDGPALPANAGHDIVSDGIVAGALQVPGDGRPYVLTADHQTTGGYPKIAVLASVDLARFVRVPPGQDVRFSWCDVPTARRRLRAALQAVEESVVATPRPHAHQLGRENLIGGVAGPGDHAT